MGRRLIWCYLFCALIFKGCAAGVVLKIDPEWSTLFVGETVTLTCDVEGGDADWEFSLIKDDQRLFDFSATKNYKFRLGSTYDSGEYQCVGHRLFSHQTERSQPVSVTVADRPKATLRKGSTTISVRGSVRLSCSVEQPDGWTFEFYSRTHNTWGRPIQPNDGVNGAIQVSKGGVYWCRGVRGTSSYVSFNSDDVTVQITYTIKPVITRQPSWSHMFQGEQIKLTCEVQGGENIVWWYYWRRKSGSYLQWNQKVLNLTASESLNGDYECMARRTDDSYSSTMESEAFTVSVLDRPKATLTSGNTTISVGGSVRLSCSVEQSDGWTFEFYRKIYDTTWGTYTWGRPIQPNDGVNGVIQVSEGGVYRCRGVRGTSGYYSLNSDEVTIRITYTIKPVITRQPSWSHMFQGEQINLTCEVQGGENIDWDYYWWRSGSSLQHYEKVLHLTASESLNGDYQCWTSPKDDSYSSTRWSEAFTVLPRPKAQLSTNRFNMSEGSSVTLTCSVEPSDGWKFFWYRDEKKSSLITHGTDASSNQSEVSQEGRYWCRGGRGDPVYYTEYSDPLSITKIPAESSSVFPMWTIGLICGLLLLLLLLLLLFGYRKTKDSGVNRSQSSQQNHSPDHASDQPEDQANTYASLFPAEPAEVTYSSINLKNLTNAKKKRKAEENTVYSDVTIASSEGEDVTYAQVFSDKAKGKSGRTAPAATEETFYSEVKVRTSRVQ